MAQNNPNPANDQAGNVLDTLTSIRTQVSDVLHQLQQAKVSVTVGSGEPLTVMNTSEGAAPDTGPAPSRDEVKCQREAKKAVKAARKNKSLAQAQPTTENATKIAGSDPVPSSVLLPTSSLPKSDKVKETPPDKKTKNNKNTCPSPLQVTEKSQVDKSKPLAVNPHQTTPETVRPESQIVKVLSPIERKTEREQKKAAAFEAEMEKVNPRFRELGLKFKKYLIRGSNLRTIALLTTTKNFINGYKTPDGKGFKQDLSIQLQFYFEKLKLYRPFAVGMTTSVDGINGAIRGLEEGLPDQEYKEELEIWCDRFVEEKIYKAVEAIAEKACEKILDGDTILAFSLTDALFSTFKLAGEIGRKFNLILAITKSESYLREYKQLRESMGAEVFKKQVNVSCINISSIMSFIPTVDKVFLGGHALFTTGGVMSHAGSSTIALCASQHNVPVIFFCETYKFCDKSPTDAFYSDVFPENKFGLSGDSDDEYFEIDHPGQPSVAQIRYDVTPVSLVTCVITDIDMLPSSSVPVVLRVQESRPLTKCS